MSTGSLGFNPNRRHRNATVGIPRIPVRRTNTPRSVAKPAVAKSEDVFVAPKQESIMVPQEPTNEDLHFVFATVCTHLYSSTNEIVGEAGTRVMLWYPMKMDEESGFVFMKRKTVVPDTGQLKLDWVRVYDSNSDTHLVSDFSVFP